MDPIHQVGTDVFEGWAEWRVSNAKNQEELAAAAKDVGGIILRARLTVDGPVMDAAPGLLVVGRHGVGVDNVNVAAAAERGIWVVNTPEANFEAVAEHAWGMILALARSLHLGHDATRNGNWHMRDEFPGVEVLGATLGIIGMGRIGARVAEIGVRGFSQRVLYSDVASRPELEQSLGISQAPLEELLNESDIVTIHVPALPSTVGMIDAPQFEQMKPGVIFVNASRGGVVVESALVDALDSGRVRAAGVDVFAIEPPPADLPLLHHPKVMLSPHKAGVSELSVQRMALVSEDIARVLRGEEPRYPVNSPASPRRPAV